jgi:hypothetical protein
MKGVLPWLVRRACRAGTRDLHSALAALIDPVQKILFSSPYYFNSFVPIADRSASWQAVVLGRLSFMCLWLEVLIKCASYFFYHKLLFSIRGIFLIGGFTWQ